MRHRKKEDKLVRIKELVRQKIDEFDRENTRNNQPMYPKRPIPCEIDALISDFVRMFMQASPPDRWQISAAVPPRDGAFFIHFAQRMATLGVRDQSRQRLLEGLVALLIEGYKEDFRDNIISLGPLYDAALKINVAPQELFDEAAAYLDNGPARDIMEFPQREPGNRSLGAMGFIESSDADGFKYQRTW